MVDEVDGIVEGRLEVRIPGTEGLRQQVCGTGEVQVGQTGIFV